MQLEINGKANIVYIMVVLLRYGKNLTIENTTGANAKVFLSGENYR